MCCIKCEINIVPWFVKHWHVKSMHIGIGISHNWMLILNNIGWHLWCWWPPFWTNTPFSKWMVWFARNSTTKLLWWWICMTFGYFIHCSSSTIRYWNLLAIVSLLHFIFLVYEIMRRKSLEIITLWMPRDTMKSNPMKRTYNST